MLDDYLIEVFGAGYGGIEVRNYVAVPKATVDRAVLRTREGTRLAAVERHESGRYGITEGTGAGKDLTYREWEDALSDATGKRFSPEEIRRLDTIEGQEDPPSGELTPDYLPASELEAWKDESDYEDDHPNET